MTAKKEYNYTTWKDLLTSYDGREIVYDAQGNPTTYLGHTLTWEKGRQLKSFDSNTYTYNANGIRTSKTVDGVTHTYTLDGTKILRETWGNNTLIPLYDNEESVCGIYINMSRNKLPNYTAFPNKKSKGAYYNCNSFTKGLLDAAKIPCIKPPRTLPGWTKPLPRSYFGI